MFLPAVDRGLRDKYIHGNRYAFLVISHTVGTYGIGRLLFLQRRCFLGAQSPCLCLLLFQSGLNVRVASDVIVIVISDELVLAHGQVGGQRDKGQEDWNQNAALHFERRNPGLGAFAPARAQSL